MKDKRHEGEREIERERNKKNHSLSSMTNRWTWFSWLTHYWISSSTFSFEFILFIFIFWKLLFTSSECAPPKKRGKKRKKKTLSFWKSSSSVIRVQDTKTYTSSVRSKFLRLANVCLTLVTFNQRWYIIWMFPIQKHTYQHTPPIKTQRQAVSHGGCPMLYPFLATG